MSAVEWYGFLAGVGVCLFLGGGVILTVETHRWFRRLSRNVRALDKGVE